MSEVPSDQAGASGGGASGLSQPPPGQVGWWQASDALWYPPAPPGGYTPPPQPGYGQPQMAQHVVAQQTNGLAIAAMILGILWLWFIGSILALVFGYISKSQIEKSQGTQSGKGMATAGIVLGWIGLAVVFFLIIAVTFLGTSASQKFNTVGSSIN